MDSTVGIWREEGSTAALGSMAFLLLCFQPSKAEAGPAQKGAGTAGPGRFSITVDASPPAVVLDCNASIAWHHRGPRHLPAFLSFSIPSLVTPVQCRAVPCSAIPVLVPTANPVITYTAPQARRGQAGQQVQPTNNVVRWDK